MTSELAVRTLRRPEHLDYIAGRPSVSFLQTPAWGDVKSDWDAESIGWFDAGGHLHGAGLVLYRQVPRLRRYLAYLPEGPDLRWAESGVDLRRWLDPLATFLRRRRAFGIRMGPPVVMRRWTAATVKQAIADADLYRLTDVPADVRDDTAIALADQLHALGWRPLNSSGGFAPGQPAFNFHLPLAGPDGPLDEGQVLAGMNQQWRRNIRKAEKAGVDVRPGKREDLADFHRVYLETAERDGFTPRPLGYFETMWDALRAEHPDRMTLYLAHHEGDLAAATTMIRVGTHVWYSYGASTTAHRDVRASNAVQWQMIRDALAEGARVYDLRGITDTLAEDDPQVGLIRFKAGTGGEAVQYLGEWDLPLNRPLYAAFTAYMARR